MKGSKYLVSDKHEWPVLLFAPIACPRTKLIYRPAQDMQKQNKAKWTKIAYFKVPKKYEKQL